MKLDTFDLSRLQFLSAALAIWLLLVISYAVWIFVIPPDFVVGPEVGPLASYLILVSV
jgi:hypothetical protein